MGYFSNNNHFDWYWGKYCSNCANWKIDDTGIECCPIISLHWLCQNNPVCGNKVIIQEILDFFIPRDKKGNNKQCRMFILKEEG